MSNYDDARTMAKDTLAEVARTNLKTHHLGNNGNWLINSKTGEKCVCVSTRGATGLVKITMPMDKLPKQAIRYGKKAVQAHHMTWLNFDTPKTILKKAILARVKAKKTMYEYAEEIYGNKQPMCWVKYTQAKGNAKTKLVAIQARKAKLLAQEKALKSELKARNKAAKAKTTKTKAPALTPTPEAA